MVLRVGQAAQTIVAQLVLRLIAVRWFVLCRKETRPVSTASGPETQPKPATLTRPEYQALQPTSWARWKWSATSVACGNPRSITAR